MATALVKGLAAVTALGTASGVGTLLYLNTKNSLTIEDKLASENLKLISEDEDYKFHLFEFKENKKLKDAIWEQSINHETQVSKLKQWCKDNLKKSSSEDKDGIIFENAKSWCVVPTIRKLGDKVKGTFYGEQEWATKYGALIKGATKADFEKALKAEFSNLTFNETTNNDGQKFKEWCGKVKEIKIYEADENKSEKNFKDWCIKP